MLGVYLAQRAHGFQRVPAIDRLNGHHRDVLVVRKLQARPRGAIGE
jgi:hypothetical protein